MSRWLSEWLWARFFSWLGDLSFVLWLFLAPWPHYEKKKKKTRVQEWAEGEWMDQQQTKRKGHVFIVLFVCLLLTTSVRYEWWWLLVHILFVTWPLAGVNKRESVWERDGYLMWEGKQRLLLDFLFVQSKWKIEKWARLYSFPCLRTGRWSYWNWQLGMVVAIADGSIQIAVVNIE